MTTKIDSLHVVTSLVALGHCLLALRLAEGHLKTVLMVSPIGEDPLREVRTTLDRMTEHLRGHEDLLESLVASASRADQREAGSQS
jgi:hypothetical protein